MGWFNTMIDNKNDSDQGFIAQNVSEVLESLTTSCYCYTLGKPTGSSYIYGCSGSLPNVTINTTNPLCYSHIGPLWNGCSSNHVYTQQSSNMCVCGNSTFDGDVIIKGVNICEVLNKIESRLAILQPDPKKLEHFEALKKAYDHYKVLEALCELPIESDEH